MNKEAGKDKLKRILKWNLIGYVPLMLLAIGLLVPDMAFAAAEDGIASASGMGFIAAALSTGFANHWCRLCSWCSWVIGSWRSE